MWYFSENIKELMCYLICEKYPVTQYVTGAVDSLNDTVSIMDRNPWTCTPLEMGKLFFSRYVATALCIAITGLLWILYGEQMATAWFYEFDVPNWMLPICLYVALKIFSRILGEGGCCLGTN